MVFIQRGAVKVGRHKLYQHRHEVTIAADGGVINLLLIGIIAYSAEGETAILLTYE